MLKIIKSYKNRSKFFISIFGKLQNKLNLIELNFTVL